MLPCARHVLNLLAKDVCRYIHPKYIVMTRCALANYFMVLRVWFHISKEWIRNKTNIVEKHTLAALCENCWNAMIKTYLGIAMFNQLFFDSLQNQGKVDGCTAVKNNITNVVA
jgi:hypothetical protein